MKVMYFTFEGFDTPNGINHLAIKMIDSFLNNDISVYLLTSHSLGMADDIPDVLKNREEFTYDIVQRKKVNKQNFIQRYLEGFIYSFKAFKHWRKNKDNIDIVLLQATPTVFFSSILLKLFLRKPVIFNCYDIFPDGPYAYNAISNSIIYHILHKMQDIVYRNSNRIVVVSHDMKETFIKNKVNEDKLVIINNWYDENSIKINNESKNTFIQNYHIDTSKFIIQYAGNFGYTFNYKKILEIALQLQEYEKIEIHMIGTGAFEKDFKEEAEKLKLKNIIFIPWQPLDIITDVYNSCDIGIIALSKNVIKNNYPSKCSILMACGKPFVCVTEKDTFFYKYVNDNKIGFCSPQDDIKDTINKILLLYQDKNLHEQMSNNAKIFGKRDYSSKPNIKKYIELLEEVYKNEYIQK